jgi:hypothetical protein
MTQDGLSENNLNSNISEYNVVLRHSEGEHKDNLNSSISQNIIIMDRKDSIDKNIENNNVNKSHYSKFVAQLLSNLNKLVYQTGFISNEDTQKSIENLIIDEFGLFSSNNKKYYLSGINTELLGPILSKYIIDRQDLIVSYIDKLKNSYNVNDSSRTDQVFIREIINTVDKDFILNLCLLHFLLVYVHQDSGNDEFSELVGISVKIGKKIVKRYFLRR